MEVLFTIRTAAFPPLQVGVHHSNNRPSWDRIASIYSQFKLLYVLTSILISIPELLSKLNYPCVTLDNCALNNVVTLQKTKVGQIINHQKNCSAYYGVK